MEPSARQPGLDLVRIGAAFAVFGFHLASFDSSTGVFGLRNQGNIGVGIFFALSGYLVYRPFLRGPVIPGKFLLRRFIRILPSATVAIVGVRLLLPPEGVLWLTIVLWSLLVELTYYAVLPWIARIVAGREIVGIAALGVGSLVGDHLMPSVGVPLFAEPLGFFLLFWAFAPGMILAVVERDRPELTARYRYLPLGIAVMLFGLSWGPDEYDAFANPWSAVVIVLGGTLVMSSLVAWKSSRLSLVALAADATYPFYLLHAPVLATLQPLMGGIALGVAAFAVTAAASVAIVIVVERPVRHAFNARQAASARRRPQTLEPAA